jgi:hypothetical protein
MDACGHVLSSQALNNAASRGPAPVVLTRYRKNPERSYWEPGRVLGQGDETDWVDR